jgi:hypothetical protein
MGLLEIVIVVLVVMWVTGSTFAIGGSLISLLLALALVLIVVRLARGGHL